MEGGCVTLDVKNMHQIGEKQREGSATDRPEEGRRCLGEGDSGI